MYAYSIRSATPEDATGLIDFIFEHGENPWNHLPVKAVRDHLLEIGAGRIEALMAVSGESLLGFVSYQPDSQEFLRYQPRQQPAHSYVCEAVVHRDAAGNGIGSALLAAVVETLQAQGVTDIYIDRHQDNLASAGMMIKVGFAEVACYDDPARRPNGTRRTTVCRLRTAAD
jgi:ribosomal protein S18 acetylase RimI-like enzyme